LREVAAHGEYAIVTAGHARDLAGSGAQRRLGAPAECDATPFRGQCPGAGEAESATRSSDDGDFIPQSEIHWLASYKITKGAMCG
jgi:hypothetical protein